MRLRLTIAVATAAAFACCAASAPAATTTAFRDYRNDVRLTAVKADDGTLRVTKFSAWVTMGCGWRLDRGSEKFGGETTSVENQGNAFNGEIQHGPNDNGLISGSVTFSGHSETRGGKPVLVGTVSMTATGTSDDGEEPKTCEWGPIDFTAVPPDKEPPRITSVSIKPSPFHVVAPGIFAPKPSQGGVTIRFRLSEETGNTTITFKRTSQSGCSKSAPTICSEQLYATGAKGKNKRYWNGRERDAEDGKPLRTGTYKMVIRAIDYAGNKGSATRTVKVVAAP